MNEYYILKAKEFTGKIDAPINQFLELNVLEERKLGKFYKKANLFL